MLSIGFGRLARNRVRDCPPTRRKHTRHAPGFRIIQRPWRVLPSCRVATDPEWQPCRRRRSIRFRSGAIPWIGSQSLGRGVYRHGLIITVLGALRQRLEQQHQTLEGLALTRKETILGGCCCLARGRNGRSSASATLVWLCRCQCHCRRRRNDSSHGGGSRHHGFTVG